MLAVYGVAEDRALAGHAPCIEIGACYSAARGADRGRRRDAVMANMRGGCDGRTRTGFGSDPAVLLQKGPQGSRWRRTSRA